MAIPDNGPREDDVSLSPQPTAPVVDPVCGMVVDPGSAQGMSEFGETRVFFCSDPCKRRFDANPEEYAEGRDAIRIPMH